MQHVCPHCKDHKIEDGFESLDEGEMHLCTCDSCGLMYSLFIKECEYCMTDAAFTFPQAPAAQSLKSIDCDACGHKLHKHQEPDLSLL